MGYIMGYGEFSPGETDDNGLSWDMMEFNLASLTDKYPRTHCAYSQVIVCVTAREASTSKYPWPHCAYSPVIVSVRVLVAPLCLSMGKRKTR